MAALMLIRQQTTILWVVLALVGSAIEAESKSHVSDCVHLYQFHEAASVNGPWKNETGWPTQWHENGWSDCCDWYGVTCHQQHDNSEYAFSKVAKLNLTHNGLSGMISPALQYLTHLQWLYLDNNNLWGNFHETNWTHLRGEYICEDPSATMTMHYDLFEKCFQSCAGTCNLIGGLEVLKLNNNQITGYIPDDIARLYKTLKVLDLGTNRMHGKLPMTMGALTQLTDLNLFYNRMEGEIPDEIGFMLNLRYMNLAFNHFSGYIPETVQNLVRLEQLDLSVNAFEGHVPTGLGVLVSPPPWTCDHPGGECFGHTMMNMSLETRGKCEPGQYVLWYVMGFKQPCNPSVTDSQYWCNSCDPPYPSLKFLGNNRTGHSTYSDCRDNLPEAPAEPNLLEDFTTYPWAPLMPDEIRVEGPGPTLRITIQERCTLIPSLYATQGDRLRNHKYAESKLHYIPGTSTPQP